MYFVTDEPKLFCAYNGTVIQRRVINATNDNIFAVEFAGGSDIFKGTKQECDDFIYSLAGWVGAVNPWKSGGGSNGF